MAPSGVGSSGSPTSARSSPSTSTRREFAQVFGSVVLAVSLLAFALGLPVVGWLLAGAVAALQTVLALTGYCLGCRLYFLRWWVPGLVTRFWRRGLVEPRTPIRF